MKTKALFSLLLCLALAAAGGGCTSGASDGEAKDSLDVADTMDLILSVRQTSRLYTAEYRVHKIVTYEDVRHLSATVLGHKYQAPISLGDRKIAIPIDVTLRAYVDFSTFSESQIERSADGRHLHVTLSDPKVIVTSSRVDHEQTRQFVDILRSDFSDAEMADFTEQGVRSILRQVPQMGILETARQSAAVTLIPLFSRLGYHEEDIVVTFRKEFTEKDLPFYYDSEGR
jgi:hypothetical protein